MATENKGFHFNFGDEHPTIDSQLSSSSYGTSWSSPTVSTQCSPWISLNSRKIKEWEANYPGSTSGSMASVSGTRDLTLCIPSRASSGAVYQLCYQTPPKTEVIPLSCTVEESAMQKSYASTSPDVHQRDIIPGQYYGGLKVWSCAPLLAQYLLDHEEEYRNMFASSSSSQCRNSKFQENEKQSEPRKKLLVAEVGCGHSLPGLAALCLGTPRLLLHDYNKEVLESCTGPNVAATIRANHNFIDPSVQLKLVHGDWVDLRLDGEDGADFCDIVLGSDVTFDKEACEKLVCLLHRWLTPISGFAIIASKEYYFGTNGGRLELIESAKRYNLKVETLEYFKGGGSMDRVIVKIIQS